MAGTLKISAMKYSDQKTAAGKSDLNTNNKNFDARQNNNRVSNLFSDNKNFNTRQANGHIGPAKGMRTTDVVKNRLRSDGKLGAPAKKTATISLPGTATRVKADQYRTSYAPGDYGTYRKSVVGYRAAGTGKKPPTDLSIPGVKAIANKAASARPASAKPPAKKTLISSAKKVGRAAVNAARNVASRAPTGGGRGGVGGRGGSLSGQGSGSRQAGTSRTGGTKGNEPAGPKRG